MKPLAETPMPLFGEALRLAAAAQARWEGVGDAGVAHTALGGLADSQIRHADHIK